MKTLADVDGRGAQVADFVVPVPVQAQLRSYQQDGVNWLAFLKRYNLHGILCDDMGLGKTLQTICILAADHEERQRRADEPLPSLVVCPPTLTGHWVYEVRAHLQRKSLTSLAVERSSIVSPYPTQMAGTSTWSA